MTQNAGGILRRSTAPLITARRRAVINGRGQARRGHRGAKRRDNHGVNGHVRLDKPALIAANPPVTPAVRRQRSVRHLDKVKDGYVMEEAIASRLLESIAAEQMFILCGAGLSMAPPSSLPSAASVARTCRERYRTELGSELDPSLGNDLESIARYFHARGTFDGLFLAKLVPWAPFRNSPPNVGHEAVADFVACKAVTAVVTTNFDMLCEGATEQLGEPDFRAIVDAADLPIPTEHGWLLKVHGCALRSRSETIWCREQLQQSPTRERLQRFAAWLAEQLSGRDLLVIGFWSDWAYLTELFAANLASVGPRSVYVINPDSDEQLRQKAPQLWAWAHGPGVQLHHVRVSGEIFLDELRRIWSARFVTRLMDAARPTYESFFGPPPNPPPDLGGACESRTLYALRRDLTGTPRSRPVRERTPSPSDHVAAAIHRRLLCTAP